MGRFSRPISERGNPISWRNHWLTIARWHHCPIARLFRSSTTLGSDRRRGGGGHRGHAIGVRGARIPRRLTILAGVATWEREITLERQREGVAKAKAAGKYKGRPVSIDAGKVKQLRATLGPAAIAKRLGIARSSVYRALG
jgi:hypothetical protein